MVMVLLFLGVIFLLLGWQALGSGDSDDDSAAVSSMPTVTTTTTAATIRKTEPPKTQAEVRVFNISEVTGAAGRTGDELKDAGFNVTEVGNLTLPDVSATTVYFGDAEGERATAEAVGQKLGAPVLERVPGLADQPPGVIVVVTR